MSLSITQVQNKIAPKLRGTTIAKLAGTFYDKCAEAGVNVLARTSPLETIRSSRIESAIYSNVYNYAINQDIRGDRGVIDIRPISLRSNQDDVAGRTNREFDIRRDRDTFSVEMINGVKTLRLSKQLGTNGVLHTMDSLSVGGTVAGSGDVTDLTVNTLDYISGYASVQFGLSGATGQGKITIALDTTADLSTIEDIGALFNWMSFPDVSRLTNMKFRWGNDSGNYWEKIITSPHDRSAFEDTTFTLQRADWVDATETGTPDSTLVDWIEVELNYTGATALANVRLDNITYGKGSAYELVYYSDRFFKSTSNTYLAVPTAGTDVINIGGDGGHNIFLYELMLVLAQELGEKTLTVSKKFLMEQLNGYGDVKGLYDQYNSQYPSKIIPQSTTYYNF